MKIIRLKYGLIILILLPLLFFSDENYFNPINNFDRNELINPIQSQFSDESLTVLQNFSLIEISENTTTLDNVDSVDIDMGTSRWNITNIKINITNIFFKNETKVIEDVPTSSKTIKNLLYCLGVQIEIVVPTIIYGVSIYGQNRTTSTTLKNVYLQIQGNNKNSGMPNGSILGSVKLNMSKSIGLGWHKHNFISPLNLTKGFYYLVINGTDIGNTPNIFYDWYYNHITPNYPYLNSSQYTKDMGAWSIGESGVPFLYKLIQRINQSFYPEEINMTAKINGIYYPFNKINEINAGNLSVSFNSFFPNTKILQIPIKNNISNALFFNSSYYIKLNNSLISSGSVQIKDGLENSWTINPILERFGWNYTVFYKIPNSWDNIEIYRNSIKLIMDNNYTINQNTLTILNNSISSPIPLYIPWKITANSTFFELKLKNPLDGFEASKQIGFIIDNPKIGKYTFVLMDIIPIKQYENSTIYSSPPSVLSFNWTLPSNAISGVWNAYFFWNNQTDAGAVTHPFTVSGGTSTITTLPSSDEDGNGKTEVTGLDPFLVFMIILIIGIVSASSFTSYVTLKKVKKNRDIRRKKLLDKVSNILNLSHIIVIDKNSGLNVYQEFYGGRDLDTTLVSGFLDAIRSFGIELTSARTQSQIISLEYQESKILMAEFKSFRLILIMGEKASEEFLEAITNLSYDIDNNFGEELKNFKGDTVKFRDIRHLIEKHLNTAFVYPLNVIERKEVEPNPSERAMIHKAKKFMKENNINYFFTSFLFTEQNLNQKDIETIFKLLDKKIFQPIDLSSNIK